MQRSEIVELLKQMNPMHMENDGPTVIFAKCGKKTKTFCLSSDKNFIIVTTGRYLFKRKYKINRNEL